MQTIILFVDVDVWYVLHFIHMQYHNSSLLVVDFYKPVK